MQCSDFLGWCSELSLVSHLLVLAKVLWSEIYFLKLLIFVNDLSFVFSPLDSSFELVNYEYCLWISGTTFLFYSILNSPEYDFYSADLAYPSLSLLSKS